MSSASYLFRLADRLTGGLAHLDSSRRDRHIEFILSQQMPDGGFRGREGESDLYYTGFAVRGLAVLDALSTEQSQAIANYLKGFSLEQLNVIDLVSWLYSALVAEASGISVISVDATPDWPGQIADKLEKLRTDDGGYAKSPEGAAGSTYHSFLVSLSYELMGQTLPRSGALVQFIYDRQRDDGGFVEIAPMKRSGTNPTAAAVALLDKFGALDDEVRSDVCGFLGDVRSGEGGFQANSRIPFADGLSTFTGLLTAQDLGCSELLDSKQVETFFVNELEFPTGGFRGASWDRQADVEYTFYGLGVLGLLRSV